ncbi:condensation domain-containing protein [Amycolatopsis sp. lyj-23]|uniref:condensation domain-containing protein n=1 Tax=Amycolatopsis sp. lyj-23 TaxID=2789283 RepID=UPI0039781EFE
MLRLAQFGAGEIHTDFQVPEEVTDAELVRRCQWLVSREAALHTLDHYVDGAFLDGTLRVEMTRHDCDSPEDVRRFISESRHHDFPRSAGEPRWRFWLVRHPDHAGRPVRSGLAIFDHFIADRRSAALARRELATGVPFRQPGSPGDYRDWIDSQRIEFNPGTHHGRAAAGFWRRHLDGGSPNEATPLPVYADAPTGQRRGTIWHSVHVPVDVEHLTRICRASGCTPFVLTMASIAATTAELSKSDDLTLRIVTSGRTPSSAATFGWLNSCVPIRLRHRELAALQGALAAAKQAWREVLPYQHTPWEYLWRTCAPDGAPEHGWLGGRRQLLVNYFPDTVDGLDESAFVDRVDPVLQQDYLALYIVPLSSGGFMFRLIGDADDVDPVLARRLLDTLRANFLSHARTMGKGVAHQEHGRQL